ncbi:TPA: ABC transporter substrate-binding protein [Corynebacterium aurimucosum]|nr:ABC transporter substrate-binding protein [Corynebacterium aurimucosum]
MKQLFNKIVPQRRMGLIRSLILVALVLATTVIVFSQFRATPPKKITNATISAAEWDPYIGPNLRNDGPVAEMIRDIFRMQGIQVSFSYSDWASAEREVLDNVSIGVAPVVDAPHRKEYGSYSDPILSFSYVLFGKQGNSIKEKTKNDLSDIRIGRISGYQYWDELDNSGASFSTFNDGYEAFNALANDQVDLVAEGSIAGNTILESPTFEDSADLYEIVELDPNLSSDTRGLHLFMNSSNESKLLMSQFNEGLRKYKQTTTYKTHLKEVADADTQVSLSTGDNRAVEVYSAQNEMLIGRTPRCTEGILRHWPSSDGEMAEVKITSGPFSGRIAKIHIDNLEVING